MPKVKDEKPEPDSVLIEVPIAEVPAATWGLHINTHLTPEQSQALRSVTAALDKRLARLSNGRRVVNPCDALKFLLDQICTARRVLYGELNSQGPRQFARVLGTTDIDEGKSMEY